MKIAIIAPVIRKISTKNLYGGIERIITSLIYGATDAGHEVTLYAPFGTDLVHKNLTVRLTTDADISSKGELIKIAEAKLFQRIIDDQQQFDIIHTQIEPIVASYDDDNYLNKIVKPVVVTFHNQTHIDENIDYYKSHKKLHRLNYVFISHDQSAPLAFLPLQTVIYNGINLGGLTFNTTPNPDQLAFVGRITPEKGVSQAIAIAKMANKKLLIAAAIDHSQQDYYENQIKPLLDGQQIVYLGEISNERKNELLGTSEALLFPIRWHEPFGLVITEAMATGTPVIATDIGSVVEIVEEGKTGFTVSDIDNIQSYVDKIKEINVIDRKYCRQVVENKFTEDIMVSNYLKYYESILNRVNV